MLDERPCLAPLAKQLYLVGHAIQIDFHREVLE